MRSLTYFSLAVFIILSGACTQQWDEIAVSSPNMKLQMVFTLENGKPAFTLTRNDEFIFLKSPMGFTLDALPDLDSNFVLLNKTINSFDSQWEQPWGETRFIRNNYNELKLFLQEADGPQRKMNIIFRLFNEGFAFCYEFPEQEFFEQFKIMEEKTAFVLPGNDSAWWIKAYQPERYEYLYQHTPLSGIDTAHTPLTMKTRSGLYLSFHEAALYDFPSYTLYTPDTNVLAVDLVPWMNGVKAYVETPFRTSWRSVLVAKEPADLITNYQILNLNDSSKIEDTSWIRPGKYVGIWWGMHLETQTWGSGPNHGATTENAMAMIDFASENGFSGVLVEGWNTGWDGDWIANGEIFSFTEAYPDFDLQKVTSYAAEKGLKLIGHHETSANTLNYEKQMEDAYSLYEQLGVNTIKTGYVGNKLFNGEWHHGQFGVRHYQKTVELAARHHIMLNIHEPIKDCGLRRTWPNLLSREGQRGMEYNAWAAYGGNPPNHVPTLVFTRLLAAPMDYTPGIFDIMLPDRPDNRVNTTLAKQLAYYVVIYSPLQMAADLPENYIGNPAFQFIRDVPCDWQETHALNGEIGEFVTIVRKDRNSEDWYLGSITNEKPRSFAFKLDFLDKGVEYEVDIYADTPQTNWKDNPLPIMIRDTVLTSNDSLHVYLAPGGGQAIRFHAPQVTEETE